MVNSDIMVLEMKSKASSLCSKQTIQRMKPLVLTVILFLTELWTFIHCHTKSIKMLPALRICQQL